jgi:hypothetical protein
MIAFEGEVITEITTIKIIIIKIIIIKIIILKKKTLATTILNNGINHGEKDTISTKKKY